ncbi:MAG: CHAT domain-containing protein [Pirellulaceae bacterium]
MLIDSNLRWVRAATRAILFFLFFACLPPGFRLQAQQISTLPRADYYLALELFGAGRVPEAREGFRSALQRSRRMGDQRWVDSVAPLVMLGECFYQQGNVAQALEQYDAALMLMLQNQNWVNEIQVDVEQLPFLEGISKEITWFQRSRPSQSVAVPEAVQIAIDPTQAQADGQGGVTVPVTLLTRLDATEICRTTGIALLRRWELLGPLGKSSPISQPMSDYFAQAPAAQVMWLQSSWRVLRGLSRLTIQGADALASLRSGVLLDGQYDYFLSPLALLAIAELEAEQGNYAAAITAAQDASLFAAYFEQHRELADALRLLGGYACASSRGDLLQPLQQATAWSTKRSALAFTSGAIASAEVATYSDRLDLADRYLKQANAALRNVALPRRVADRSFIQARMQFAQNRGTMGVASLDNALGIMRGTSETGVVVERVFQTQMTLDLLAASRITGKVAEEFLDELLAEPDKLAWKDSPLDVLTTMTTASLPAFERHLEMAVLRGDQQETVQRLDRLQRQRFYETLPLGGRLLSWRVAAQRDPASLPPDVRQIVQQKMLASPAVRQLRDQVVDAVRELANGTLPLDERQLVGEKKKYADLENAAKSLESQLAFLALHRSAMPRFVPGNKTPGDMQASLQKGDVLIGFAATRTSIVGMAMTQDQLETWNVMDAKLVFDLLQQFRNEIGLGAQVPRILPSAVTARNAAWWTTATKLRDQLLPAPVQTLCQDADRLIVSPSGALWYLPFEALPDAQHKSQPFLAHHRVTYVPTIGSVSLANRTKTPMKEALGLVGGLFALDKEVNKSLADNLVNARVRTARVQLGQKITAGDGAWLQIKPDTVWVAARSGVISAPWETPMLPLGRSKQMTFGELLQSPLSSPERVILPGLEASFATGVIGDGREVFLPACSLLISGTRTALISRWPVGGRSASAILRRYLDELQTSSSSTAYRRAIIANWPAQYLIADEPALMPAGKQADALTSGWHPALWAGYVPIGDDPVTP